MEDVTKRRPGGRSARVRAAVLGATIDALLTGGMDQVGIAEIAAKAGVHETSIYRRWRTRENLIVDALFAQTEQVSPDTGSLRGDLVAAARSLIEMLSSPLGALLVRASALTVRDPEVESTRDRFWTTRFAFAEQLISRAVDRGELPAGTIARPAIDMLAGTLYLRALMTQEPFEQDLPERLADAVLFGLTGPR